MGRIPTQLSPSLSLASRSSSTSPLFLHAVPRSTPGWLPRLRSTPGSRCTPGSRRLRSRGAATSGWSRRRRLLGRSASSATSPTRRHDGTSPGIQLAISPQSTPSSSGRTPWGLGAGQSALSAADAVHGHASTTHAWRISMRMKEYIVVNDVNY